MIGVTGLNGFVGSCLYGFLQKTEHNIIGLSTNPKTYNAIKLLDGIPLEKLKKINSMIHCGGLVGNGFTKMEYEYANVECTKNLLKWCEQTHVEHFVFFSTGGVYGEKKEWVDETANLDPEGYYSESKVLAEELVLQCGIPIKTIIRLYFPMGSFQYKHLFSKIAYDLHKKKEVFLNDKLGHPCISPIYVDDICRIILKIINMKISGVYNLSANIDISIGEIVDIMSALYEIAPQRHIRNCECGNYLGKADKVILATGYDRLINPRDALNLIIRDSFADQ